MTAPSAGTGAPVGFVDLRSDTVTRPTEEMRRAMAAAEVGDDGFGEDPTVSALEARYAALVGKPAALFVPSGTMANQIAVRVLSVPGTAVVAGRHQHVVAYEMGAATRNSSIQFHTVDDANGRFRPEDVEDAVARSACHQVQISLVCVEDTHMASGGVPWPIGELEAVRAAAGSLPVHMDGARLLNAVVATGVDAARIAAAATTVMTCMSKGLCAPVGSVLAGPADVIEAGRVERKRLGGAMRQAGIVAAAGLVGLETMVDRLADDHERARRIADVVADRWPDAGLDPADVQTNIVAFTPPDGPRLVAHLLESGILGDTIAPGVVRLVTHHDVDDIGVERTLKAIATAP